MPRATYLHQRAPARPVEFGGGGPARRQLGAGDRPAPADPQIAQVAMPVRGLVALRLGGDRVDVDVDRAAMAFVPTMKASQHPGFLGGLAQCRLLREFLGLEVAARRYAATGAAVRAFQRIWCNSVSCEFIVCSKAARSRSARPQQSCQIPVARRKFRAVSMPVSFLEQEACHAMCTSRPKGGATAPFLSLLAGMVLFELASARWLPPIVASHFDAAGRANGFMPRTAYIGLMLVVGVLAPLFITVVPLRAMRRPNARINLPDPSYWLAPERRDATLDQLSRQVVRFASMLTLFLGYVQTLVVVANRSVPPTLPMHFLIAGLLIYLGSILVWLLAFARHFRRPSNEA